jgi:hypothetical protein
MAWAGSDSPARGRRIPEARRCNPEEMPSHPGRRSGPRVSCFPDFLPVPDLFRRADVLGMVWQEDPAVTSAEGCIQGCPADRAWKEHPGGNARASAACVDGRDSDATRCFRAEGRAQRQRRAARGRAQSRERLSRVATCRGKSRRLQPVLRLNEGSGLWRNVVNCPNAPRGDDFGVLWRPW